MKALIAPSAARRSKPGDPPWEIALLFPRQGEWTEEEYLALPTKQLVELSNGCLEVLPVPTRDHQAIARYLFRILDGFVLLHKLGETFFAPLRMRLWPGKIREPDIIFLSNDRYRKEDLYPAGADLVMEVTSPGQENRRRDLEIKPKEYAAAGIKEYWIIDPEKRRITVMKLARKRYKVHGVFDAGKVATSALLPGFEVEVNEVFLQ